MKFIHPGDSHAHSRLVLDALYEYDDFMASIATVADLGCGSGDDLVWWATRTTRDDVPEPLNIMCTGIDLCEQLPVARKHTNIVYQQTDFEQKIHAPPAGFDILWSHDSFQYCTTPWQTLARWWNITNAGGMLAISVPQTVLAHQRKLAYYLPNHCMYHHTLISLIHMLAMSGWDCRAGFFLQRSSDPWIHAIVYRSMHRPMDPKIATWHTLSELGLLPESADKSVYAHGYLRQQDLILPWIDKSLASMKQL